MSLDNKKRVNKKLMIGLGSTLAAATISSMTALGISTLVNKNNFNLNNNISQYGVYNSGYPINSTNTATIGDGSYGKPKIVTTNAYKPVPNGYVFQTDKDYLVCVDKNDMTKVLWYDTFPNWDIIQIEYMPITDSLVVLYCTSGYKITTGSMSYQVRIAHYKGISSKNDGSVFNPSIHTVTSGNTYQPGVHPLRPDLWAMSPVHYYNTPVEELIIYYRYHRENSLGSWESKVSTFNVKTNKLNLFSIDLKKSNASNEFKKEQAILGLSVMRYNNWYYFMMLVNSKWTDGWLYGFSIAYNIDSKEVRHSSGNKYISINGTTGYSDLWYRSSDTNDLIANSISSSGIGLTSNRYDATFMVNNLAPKHYGTNGYHRVPLLVKMRWDNWRTNYNSFSSISANAIVNSGPQATLGNGLSGEVWGGYFDNAYFLKNGSDTSLNGGVMTSPFIGMGYNSDISSGSKRFAFIIEDTAYDWTRSLEMNLNTTYRAIRVFPFDTPNKELISNQKLYNYWGNNSVGQLNNTQLGVPIKAYNDSSNSLKGDGAFSDNIFFTISDKNDQAIVINTQGRGSNTDSIAKYGWYTKTDVTNLNIGDPNKLVTEVDIPYLIQKYDIENPNSQFAKDLQIKNQVAGTAFAIKNIDTINYQQGYVEFNLYATKLYHSDGKYFLSSLDRLKTNFWSDHIIKKIRISNFKPAEATELAIKDLDVSNFANKKSTNGGHIGVKGNTIIPSIVIKKDAGKQKNWTKWYILDYIYQSVSELDGTSNIFKNLVKKPTYITNWTWDNFNEIFESYKIISNLNDNSANIEGKLELELILRPEYGVSANPNQKPTFRLTISGLRKIKPTKFINNTETTAFINNNWSNKNIPYINSTNFNVPNYIQPGTDVISEQEIKQWVFDNYIKTAYDNANEQNGWDSSNQWVEGVAYKRDYEYASEKIPSNPQDVDNLKFSDWKYYPKKGLLQVKVWLNVWNGDTSNGTANHNSPRLEFSKSANVDGTQGALPETDAPSGIWYIGGFRTDNVETTVNTTDVWGLTGLEQIPSNQVNDAKYRKTIQDAILQQGYAKGLITFPYWVDYSKLNSNEIMFSLNEVVDSAKGIVKLDIQFANNGWMAQQDGSIAVDPSHSWTITIKGFRTAQPIKIDASKFFDLTLSTNKIAITPSQPSIDFNNWLSHIKNQIAEYVTQQDKLINDLSASSLDVWKQRLGYKFLLETFDSQNVLQENEIKSALDNLITQSKGSLNYLYNTLTNNGIKIWVKIEDKGIPGQQFDSTIESVQTPSNPNNANGLTGLLNTSNIYTNIDFRTWFNEVQKNKGTEVIGGDQDKGTADSIVPPSAKTGVTASMSFEQVEQYLESIGYIFEYSWIDNNGAKQTSGQLPTNFSYQQSNPIITVDITFSSQSNIPPIFIFGNANENSKQLNLSLAVKKVVLIDLLETFEKMSINGNFNPTNKNIEINTQGQGNVSTIKDIQTAWNNVEVEFWDNLSKSTSIDINTLKNTFKIDYSVNDSDFQYTYDTMWSKINNDWSKATQDLSTIGRLRFYSDSITKGTKIQATVNLIDPNNVDYSLKFAQNKSEVIAKHGLSTTFDMIRYANIWSQTKAQVAQGSTFDDIKGFTPALGPNGETYDDFVNAAQSQLGMKFRYSSDKQKWSEDKNSITTVDTAKPVVYLQLSATYDDQFTWENAFNIMNFQTGVTDITSSDDNQKWSSGIEILLNLPIYLKIDESKVQEYIDSIPLSGNTKYISIDKTKEDKLVQSIKDLNPPLGTNPAPTIWVEYRLGSSGDFLDRDKFIESLKKSDVDATTNLIQMRIAVDPINENEPIYLISQQKEYDLSSENIGSNANIKIFVNQNYESDANNVSITGTNKDFAYNYNNLPIQNGSWNGSTGLKIQWTIDQSATYNDPINDSKWSDTQIDQIDPDSKYLAIRIVAIDGYVYSASYNENGHNPNPQANIHVVDVTNIKSIVEVDSSFLAQLDINGTSVQLDIAKLKQSESNVINQAVKIQSLASKIVIKYKLSIQSENDTWMSADELQAYLNKYSTEYDNSTMSILKFNTNSNSNFVGLKARFESNDEDYIPVDETIGTEETLKGKDVNTSNIVTNLDLTAWYNVLTTEFTSFAPGSSQSNISGLVPPTIGGDKGDSFMSGFTYDEIVNIFKSIGLTMMFQAPGSLTTGDNWVTLDKITSLNHSNTLLMKIVIDGADLENTYNISINSQQSTNTNPVLINLKIDLPKTIVVNPDDLKQLSIEGTTIDITNKDSLKLLETQIIDKIKNDNNTNTNTTDYNNAPILIHYSLGDDLLVDGTNVWYTLEDFAQALSSSKINFNTNKVRAKFALDDKLNNNDFQLSVDNIITINAEDKSDSAKFKMYVHVGEYVNNIANLKAVGSDDNFSISGYDEWNKTVPKGLSIQWSVDEVDAEDQVTNWLDTLPTQLGIKKKLWIRFKTNPGYVYQEQDSHGFSKGYPINTDEISIAIKLSSTWLNEIVLSGNTKKITINEDNVWTQIENANQKPPIDNLLVIQYTVNGKDWFLKDDFITHLDQLDGALDDQNFIIRRESIKARYYLEPSLNPTIGSYSLRIDGINVTEDNRDKFNIQLITDTYNQDVMGYINSNKLTEFVLSNFEVKGSTSNPKIIIKNRDALNNALNPYASDGIFDILFSTTKINDKFDFSNKDHKLWIPGQGLIDENGLIQQGIEISREKVFALSLVSISDKYEVYRDNVKQDQGYVLDISSNVQIVGEIINPLIGKVVNIKFRDQNDNPIYWQNKGSFDLYVEGENKTVEQFIQDSSLLDEEKNALEIAYAVLDYEISDAEYLELIDPNSINDFGANSKWKSLPKAADLANLQDKLGLRVDQFVVIALRTKQAVYEDKENGYIIKDANHTPTNQTRVNGYYIDIKNMEVDWSSMRLLNVLQQGQAPLDGYSTIENISLKQDSDENYKGVSLQLNLFDEFYRDANGKVIQTYLNQKLVKRVSPQEDPNVEQRGFYTDINGSNILDENGDPIPVYVYKSNGLPSKPIKFTPPQGQEDNGIRHEELIETISNSFTYQGADVDQFGLFKYQDIQIKLLGKKGLSENNLYDFYIDYNDPKQKQWALQNYVVDKEIKFPVNNEKAVLYEFDLEILDNLKYINSLNANEVPISGQSYLENQITIIRDEAGVKTKVTGPNEIVNQIASDFGQQVKIQFVYIDGNTGVSKTYDGVDVSQLTQLKNGDKIRVEIVASSSDLVFAQAPEPLTIVVTGLVEKSIDQELLKFLRVEQNGIYNNKGSFNILVNDPSSDSINDIELALLGYKFWIRVWNKDKQIKYKWTNNYNNITDLANGDKVEWKLMSPNNQPVHESYYNTISQLNSNGTFNFKQINNIGNDIQSIVGDGIGAAPELDSEVYPENSGFTIANLIDENQIFPGITNSTFNEVMESMKFSYTGINGLGNMVSKRNPKDVTITPITSKNSIRFNSKVNTPNYTLEYLIQEKMVKFYLNNQSALGSMSEFEWGALEVSGQQVIASPGILSNGDNITIIYNDGVNTYSYNAPTVSGLSQKSDSMSPLWWVLIALASTATLGIFAGIYFGTKNKKLK